jgi:hypothetical protein
MACAQQDVVLENILHMNRYQLIEGELRSGSVLLLKFLLCNKISPRRPFTT